MGQPVQVENTDSKGTKAAAGAAPDGYTLVLSGVGTNAISHALNPNLDYDSLKDFVPIAKVASNAAAIAVHPSLGIKTIQELIALGRTKNLNYASPGIGTGPHLFGQLIAMQTGAKFTNIPYKGSAPATADAVCAGSKRWNRPCRNCPA